MKFTQLLRNPEISLMAALGVIWFTIIIIAAVIFSQPPSYTGFVSEKKQFSKGVAIDLDGYYPSQKMIVFIPKELEKSVTLPKEGDKVTVYGAQTRYKNFHEVIVKTEQDFKIVTD